MAMRIGEVAADAAVSVQTIRYYERLGLLPHPGRTRQPECSRLMTAPKQIDLIYDRECPHVDATRGLLRHALRDAGLVASWREWDREAPDTPDKFKSYGSPTVLVDGIDVGGPERKDIATTAGNRCRVYRNPDGRLSGVPPLHTVIDALSDGTDDEVLQSNEP